MRRACEANLPIFLLDPETQIKNKDHVRDGRGKRWVNETSVRVNLPIFLLDPKTQNKKNANLEGRK